MEGGYGDPPYDGWRTPVVKIIKNRNFSGCQREKNR
jgi:hypothetical protein